ncbi:magnesium transporter, partial [Tremellales sp. Uapishka_1]
MSSSIASATSSATAAASSAAAIAVNPKFKIVGVLLAVGSGCFIGCSFVVKKKGLLRATAKAGNKAGEGHAYLKSWLWWTGMIMMVIMGALSVVICAILSHFVLKEQLTFFGWIGCVLCIIGATILALNAPEQQSVTTIDAFKKLFLSVGFLVWGSLLIVGSIVLVLFVAPRWGKKHMVVYISICSLIGGISVSCTQGLGSSIVTSIQGINYLNKALELFNTSMVVPFYFCFFSSATLVTSFILYQGLKASAVDLITMVLGFFVICLGITLLQMSKVDPKKLTGLDRRSTMLLSADRPTEEAEKGEVMALEDREHGLSISRALSSNAQAAGMDALRGGFGAVGSIIRARSVSRRLSNASSLRGTRPSYPFQGNSNLSTHGLGDMPRFQLSDTPMPLDAMDKISLHSAKSPTVTSPGFPGNSSYGFPQPSKSHLKFEEEDIVHNYGYTSHDGQTDAYHTTRQHPTPWSAPPAGMRQFSQGSLGEGHPVYPVAEEEEEPPQRHRFFNGRSGSPAGSPGPGERRDPYSAPIEAGQIHPLKTGLSHMFHSFASGPDLSLRRPSRDKDDSEVRGGAHRGTKDYPHLKGEKEKEHQEREALVQDDDDDVEDEDEKDEARGRSHATTLSAESDVSIMGRPMARRLPDLPK